jgi:membrane protease YdiL (CAAX protease family)
MGQAGSANRLARALHPGAALLAVLAGITAMLLTAGPAAGLGLRPALVLSELALVAPGLILAALLRRPLMEALALDAKGLRQVTLLSLGVGATLWLASLGLFEVQYSLWSPPPGYLEAFRSLHEALRPHGPLDAVVSLLAIALAPAVCEEVLFRGLVLPAFLRPLGAWGAACTSALLFGLIHLDFAAGGLSLYRVPFAAVVGLGLAALRLRAGALGPAILAHAALNAITFAAAPFTDDPSQGLPDPRPGLGLLLFGAGLGATLGLLRRFPPIARRQADA